MLLLLPLQEVNDQVRLEVGNSCLHSTFLSKPSHRRGNFHLLFSLDVPHRSYTFYFLS